MKYCMQTDDKSCVQNTAYISTIVKLKMVQSFKAITDKFTAYRIHNYTNSISIKKNNTINTNEENYSVSMI